jgi:hypothetical protein
VCDGRRLEAVARVADGVAPVADSPEWSAFCARCGRPPGARTDPPARVCRVCRMGLILQAPAEVAPKMGEPFLVVDATVRVGAVSELAEPLLAVEEERAVGRPVGELVSSADRQAPGLDLAAAIVSATRGHPTRQELTVRPRSAFGARWRARLGPCGPPAAAVLVLDAQPRPPAI